MDQMNFVLKSFFDTHHIVAQLDIETEEIIFFKCNRFNLELNTGYHFRKLIRDYIAKGYVATDDIPKFLFYLTSKNLMDHCLENQSSVLFSYKMKIDDTTIWSRVITSAPDEFFRTSSKKILIYQRELPPLESDLEISMQTLSSRFLKIVKYNIDTNIVQILKQRTNESLMREEYRKKYPDEVSWKFEEALVYKDDLSNFKRNINFSLVEEQLNSGRDSYFFYYRRKVGNMYKWVRITFIKSNEYLNNEKVFLIYLEDVHQLLVDIFDKQGLKQYQDLTDITEKSSDAYYKNTISILSYFTEKYMDFFLIDLKKNIYILYKINPAIMDGTVPYTGSYSELSSKILLNNKDFADQGAVSSLVSTEELIKLLRTRASIQYIHKTEKDQLVQSTITKIECVDGIPTKAIWYTLPYVSDKQLVIKTFGNFIVLDENGNEIKFTKKQSKQLLAYLIDKQGYPSSTRDIVVDVLEKDPGDLNAIKYVSTLTRLLIKDLEAHGFVNIIEKEYNTIRINPNKIDCDYYHLLNGDNSYWSSYHNEYMKEYSWAETTNAEILNFFS